MAKILRLSDRVKLKIGEITFTIAPLSYMQKQELGSCTRIVKGEEVFDLLKSQALYIKYALKDIDGVVDYNGEKYELSFEGDILTDDCVSEVMSLEENEKFSSVYWQILNGLKEVVDPVSGEKMEGVELKVVSEKKS